MLNVISTAFDIFLYHFVNEHENHLTKHAETVSAHLGSKINSASRRWVEKIILSVFAEGDNILISIYLNGAYKIYDVGSLKRPESFCLM